MKARADCRRGVLLCGQLFSNPNPLDSFSKISHLELSHLITYRHSKEMDTKALLTGCSKVITISEKTFAFTKIGQK